MNRYELRQWAEFLVQQQISTDSSLFKEILRELSSHQTELERQNKQLQAINLELDVEKKHAEKAKDAFSYLCDHTSVGFVIVNSAGLIVQCNHAFVSMLEMDAKPIVNTLLANIVDSRDRELYLSSLNNFFKQADPKKLEIRLLTYAKSKSITIELTGRRIDHWIADTLFTQQSDSDEFLLLTVLDIDDRKQAEENLLLSASFFDHALEGIIITDADNKIICVNSAFSHITGYSFDEVKGQNPKIFSSGKQGKEFYRQMWSELLLKGSWQGEVWDQRKNAETFPIWMNISFLSDKTGKPYRFIAIFSDITEEKKAQGVIAFQATHDQLTGIPNRTLFFDRLQQALASAKRNNLLVALLFIDLDGFKRINDTLGHNMGDKLLVAVAVRLKAVFRATDTFARFGGDEFVVILDKLHSPLEAITIARKILQELSEPFKADITELVISASIGIAIFPLDTENEENLVQFADKAMYEAKKSGRNQYHFFKQEMQLAVEKKYSIEKDLKIALSNNQLQVYFQPIVNLESGGIVGAEALLRWLHPEKGFIAPADFIPIAEECGLITKIGVWVAENAFAAANRWNSADAIYMSINKSVHEFRYESHCLDLMAIAKNSGFPLDRVVLEITETVMMLMYSDNVGKFKKLRSEGIKIFLDDFGTGYSSLSNLKKLPIDTVKIDHSFVGDISMEKHDNSLIEAMISMTNKLGLETIAEGIELEGQATFLLNLGCRFGQGYYLGRPLPHAEFLSLITP